MDIGITLTDVPTTKPASEQFDDIRRLVDAAQRAGITYIALGQHFLYGDLRWLQPIPLLARLAADVEPNVKLVTNILIGPMYHPVMLAEEIATLDIVSEGRYVFGVGIGYRPEEFVSFGINPKERGARLDEMLQLLPMLWTQDRVTFDGRFWKLDDVTPHLRPVQQPHPPIWVGGVAMAGAKRAGRLGDGYITNPEAEESDIKERLLAVQEGFAERGRPMIAQPLRRNFMFGADLDDATERYARVSQARYQAYAARGLDVYDENALTAEFARTAQAHALLGTPKDVADQLIGLAARFPVDPVMLRPQWPTMPVEEAIALVEILGREVVPAVKDVVPVSHVVVDA